MNENDGKEFAELGVKQWLIKRLFSLGTYLVHVQIVLFQT